MKPIFSFKSNFIFAAKHLSQQIDVMKGDTNGGTVHRHAMSQYHQRITFQYFTFCCITGYHTNGKVYRVIAGQMETILGQSLTEA